MCFRPSRCRRSSSTAHTTATCTSRKDAGSRHRSPMPASSSFQETHTCRGWAIPSGCLTRSRSSSRACGRPKRRPAYSRRFSSPTSSAPPKSRRESAMPVGASCSNDITRLFGGSSRVTAASSSTRPAMGSSHASRALRERSVVPPRSSAVSGRRSGSSYGQESTPASARSSGTSCTGIAVHTGARVAAAAEPGEVLVSSTVKALVAGSGIEFEDRGATHLKGIDETWQLFRLAHT